MMTVTRREKSPGRMTHVPRLEAARAQLLVIDVQERLLPHIHEQEAVVGQIVRMMRAARELDLPCTITEQYVQGLGPSAAAVREAAGDGGRIEKMTFSVCRDEAAQGVLKKNVRPEVLVAGIEAHVCVLQTVLDLLDAQLTPFVLADAVGSRRARERDVALSRMQMAGAVVTTVESAIFEMLDRCGTELFKRILPIVK